MERRSCGDGSVEVSWPAMLIEWCWTNPRATRRRRRKTGGTIRLGNKRRRVLAVRFKPVVRWRVMMGPLRKLKKLLFQIASNGTLLYWSFPLCYESLHYYYLYIPANPRIVKRGS
ncbi:hypothetical protein Sjap_005935 [Stephania japonica]|uniref:Uncharacterized protein n=1 Tax=Stephania japonica TaxID=461633 RepID=A0AAP0PJ99_9MAGN